MTTRGALDPTTVLPWFSGDIEQTKMRERLTALRLDPDWRVMYIPSPDVCDISLVYWPTGASFRFQMRPLEPDSRLWRRTL